ncbi:MAG: hypothetical protein R3345_03535, partial [Fulvivirga sp.]|nr:hypothetical protein [Fulvivirga sp.]
MEIFKKTEFEELANVHKPHCVSIYIPTHRTNAEGEGIYKDKTTLKNQLKEARKQLLTFEMKESEVDTYLKPIQDLFDNEPFWSHLSDGLAIFYDGDTLIKKIVPKKFNEFTYVDSHFYLKPMADLLHSSGRHFIMMLTLNKVEFFEATKTSICKVKIDDLVPESHLEVVGSDYEEKSLQYRSGQGEGGDADGMFHGHGDGSESEKKMEALKYFQKVDEGLMQMLHDESAPMVIACVDYLFPIYQEANNYKYLEEEHVSGNFEHEDILTMKEKAWDIVKDRFEKAEAKDKSRVEALLNEGKSAT